MNKRLIISLSAIFILASILVSVMTFVNFSDIKVILAIDASDKSILVGESIRNYYLLSDKTATVTVEIEDERILITKGDELLGLNPGRTEVTLTARNATQISKTKFTVEVNSSEISLEFVAQANCEIIENNIYMQGEFCQFSVALYEKNGTKIIQPQADYILTNDAEIVVNISSCILIAQTDCHIVMKLKDYNFSYLINVFVNQG